MSVNVTGIKDTPINITGSDDKIDGAAELHDLGTALGVSQDFLFNMLNDATFTSGESVSLDTLLDRIVNNIDPDKVDQVEALLKKVKEMEEKLPGLKSSIETATKKVADKQTAYDNAQTNKKTEKQKELDEAKKELEFAQKVAKAVEDEMKVAKEQLNTSLKKEFMKGQTALKEQIKQATGQAAASKAAESDGAGNSKPPASPFNSNPGTGGGGAATKAAAASDPYKAFNSGNKGFYDPSTAMYNTGIGDSFINDSWDMINESQKRQKMLMLFFYYARMAMSGDIGAMYQFMRFLSHVIGRDKALQNVWMGTKLLELQDKSREATKELLATEVNNDENGAWTKKLQEVKGEEGMIATSQKLITSMMEEFTQIVETLTNVTKSLLDVNGKVLSNLSQWR